MSNEVILGLIGFAGVVIGAFFQYLANRGKNSSDAQTKFTDQLITVKQDLEEKIKDCEDERYELKGEVLELKKLLEFHVNEVDVMLSYIEFMPCPAWMKSINEDGSTKMVFINEAYEEKWGVRKHQYVGKSDVDVWGEEIAERFKAHDDQVYLHGGSIRAIEPVPPKALAPISDRNKPVDWVVWKWLVIIKDQHFIAGCAPMPLQDAFQTESIHEAKKLIQMVKDQYDRALKQKAEDLLK